VVRTLLIISQPPRAEPKGEYATMTHSS